MQPLAWHVEIVQHFSIVLKEGRHFYDLALPLTALEHETRSFTMHEQQNFYKLS